MNGNPQPEKIVRIVKACGPRHKRRIRVMEGPVIIEDHHIRRGETEEAAYLRVMSHLQDDPRCGAVLETNLPYDDTLTALLLDEIEE